MVTFTLIFFAASFKAFSDTIKTHWSSSIWWNTPVNSWWFRWDATGSYKNKWKLHNEQPIPNTKHLWYYLWLYKPEYVERFWYSSTFLVLFTDGWHTGQFLMRSSFMFAIIFNDFTAVWYLYYVYLSVVYMLGFTLWWDFLLKRK